VWHSRVALTSRLDILNIFSRADLKTEVLKELERQMQILAALESLPTVDRSKLARLLNELEVLIDRIHSLHGQIGQELRQNEFLNSIKQRSSIPGGTCDFDLPGYHYWLERPAAERIRDLSAWLSVFDTIHLSVNLLLRLIRESTRPNEEHAHAGFFQKTLDPSLPCQMIRVAVDAETPYFAEISGGKHRFTVRFMQHAPDGHATQTEEDVRFELTSCII